MGDLIGRLRRRLRALTARPRLERELEDEVRTHIEMQTEENVRRGLPPDEACRAALLAFGGVERVKEECRESWGVRMLETVAQDVRYGLRGLRRSPGFAAAVVVTLALGIGANTAVFSVVNAVLLRPLPYARGEQVVVLRQADAPAGVTDLGFSVLEVKDYRSMAKSLDDVVEYHSMNFTLLGGAEAQRVRAGVVSGTFFDVLQVKPLLGRTFRPSDEGHAAEAVLVLSHDFWQRVGGDRGIVGRRFEMNDRVHTVVGVLPPIPQYPDENDVYMPASACPFRNRPATLANRRARLLNAFGRVRAGTSLDEARAELARVGQRLKAAHPEAFNAGSDPQTRVTPLKEDLVREARPTFLVLLATVALVLLIACANVANLALARLAERGRELAIRSALGAGRVRLMRQLLTESVVLSLAGGVAGLLLAVAARDSLAVFAARFTPRAAEIQIDGVVLAFTLGCAILTGILAGTLPGVPSPKRLQVALTDETGRTTAGKGRQRLRAGLVVWQLGLSFMLLIGAALMLRSFAKLRAVDGGFRTDNVLTMAVHLNFSTYSSDQQQIDREKVLGFHRNLEERVRSLPGVLAVGHAFAVPLDTTFQNNGSFRIEGRGDQGPFPRATYIGTSHEYFTALAVPVLRGRGFGPDDGVTGPQVALVSQGLARRHFKDGDAVGQRISGDGRTWRAIVGVVGDVRQAGLDREPVEAIYVPFPEFPGFSSSLFVRTAMGPIGAASSVQSFVRDLDPQVALSNVRTLDQVKQESLASPRLTTSLLAVFAAVALAITAAGLSGLVAYSVSQRTHEIGIRMALGADRLAILRMVLREGLTPVMIGLGIGLVGALVLSRFVGGLLFGLAPTDPLCFAGSALVLTLVAVAACLLPARRATAIHPLVALRAL